MCGEHKRRYCSVKKYIGCDAHARYSIFASLREDGQWDPPVRVEHDRLEMERFLKQLPAGSPVAIESSGNWYWLVQAIEGAGLEPKLAHALEAKKRMPGRNKTDHLDAKGLALMLRNGSLPEVWIPPASLLDLRDLMRTRLATREQGSELKCRILAALRRYGVRDYDDGANLFAASKRAKLAVSIGRLPQECRMATTQEWALLDQLEEHIEAMEKRIRERIASLGWVRLLKTLPGVGTILGSTIYLEIGEVGRFPDPAHLASYAGLVPTVRASGGKCWHGPTPRASNHFLKWAFIEAANVIVARQKGWADKHVVRLYQRLKANKCHGKAATAVARHLAESSWWILTKKQGYREPALATMSSSKNG
jgi:transposase